MIFGPIISPYLVKPLVFSKLLSPATSYIRVLALAGKAGGDVPGQWRGREVVVETYVPSPEVAGDESARAAGSPDI